MSGERRALNIERQAIRFERSLQGCLTRYFGFESFKLKVFAQWILNFYLISIFEAICIKHTHIEWNASKKVLIIFYITIFRSNNPIYYFNMSNFSKNRKILQNIAKFSFKIFNFATKMLHEQASMKD